MPEAVLLLFEMIGTVAFSISGAMTGIKKGMDAFGVVTLGLVTAVGGGIIRDLVLGITPPMTFRNPVYAIAAVCTALILCFPGVLRQLNRNHRLYDAVMLVMDSLGLGIFTVVGIQTAGTVISSGSIFLLLFVGVITGVGGGVLRDVLAGDRPYIFVKHIYACASLTGAVLCIFLWPISGSAAMIAGAGAVVVLRLCAARFRWSLPRPKP